MFWCLYTFNLDKGTVKAFYHVFHMRSTRYGFGPIPALICECIFVNIDAVLEFHT